MTKKESEVGRKRLRKSESKRRRRYSIMVGRK